MYDILDKILIAKAKEKAGMKGDKEDWEDKKDWGDKEDWDKEDGWPAKDGWMSSEEFEEYMEEWKWWVKFIFLIIAVGNAAALGMEHYRYRRPADYYVNGKLGGSEYNWWELGNKIFLGGTFYIMSIATVTQLLSLFDILPILNYYVWTVGVFMGVGILNAVYGWMSWKTYDEAYGVRRNRKDNKSIQEISAATAVQADIVREWNAYSVEEIFSYFTLYPLIPYWYAAMGLCDGYDIDQWHENCPEDWQKKAWERAHRDREVSREEKRKMQEERKRKEREWKGNPSKEEDFDEIQKDADKSPAKEEEPLDDPFNLMISL